MDQPSLAFIIYQSILDLPIGLILFKFQIRGRRDSLDRDGRFSLVQHLFLLYLYLIFVPQQAVIVRRLRDAGLHWSLIFLFLGPILFYLLSPISIFLVLALAGLLCLACLLVLPSARLAQPDQNSSQGFASTNPVVSLPSMPSYLVDPNSFSAIPQIVSAPPTPLEKAPLEKKMESEQTQHQFREWNEVPSEHAGFTNN